MSILYEHPALGESDTESGITAAEAWPFQIRKILSQRRWMLLRRMPELPAPAGPSLLEHSPRGSDPCAIWVCQGCGRTLVSAVHGSQRPPSSMRCRPGCGE